MLNSAADQRIETYNERKLVSNNSMKIWLSMRIFGWPVNFLAKLSAARMRLILLLVGFNRLIGINQVMLRARRWWWIIIKD